MCKLCYYTIHIDRPAVAGIAFLLGFGEFVTAPMRAINDRPYIKKSPVLTNRGLAIQDPEAAFVL